ncbi:FtsW/RodA/SpoVE family cell cycle protein [Parabacteroides sp. PF5-6]|uniref:FtsW/RodA/SpoVE family cell cycle protein n=1 Tax=Parabacteroides sp. PF5-6 TaxID=1742403 RepID=UPI0024049F81|nr:FtsW/RodA/SpoVE family cell cycle protein [Parabacteroides sp. PF5-6]MDF9829253.1 cell division protein FtsW [Parabacteroides sp. PF5-6]
MDLASKLFKGDRVIWIIFMFLCLISVVEMFSASSTITYKAANYWAPVVKHASFLFVGFILILLIHNIPYRFFSALIIVLPISMVLLVLTPMMGVYANNSYRFMEIMGIQFQPSELAKLSLIVFISFLMSKRSRFSEDNIFKYSLIAMCITCVLILPENFSTAFMLFAVCFLLLFIGQVPFLKLLKLGGGLLLIGVLLFLFFHFMPEGVEEKLPKRFSTWRARIERFSQPEEAIEISAKTGYKIPDDIFQETHAKIAIAKGGVFGKMPGHGQQRDFLPQAYSDFIYAIIIEELGMVGGLFVLLLYIMLLVRGGMIARRCEKPFAKYLVLGCTLVVVVQAFANMAVAVDLIPVTGQPLPLISRGGTSILITCIYIGIILSISRFGANIGNEEDVLPEEKEVDNVLSEEEMQSVLASVEVETIEEANI